MTFPVLVERLAAACLRLAAAWVLLLNRALTHWRAAEGLEEEREALPEDTAPLLVLVAPDSVLSRRGRCASKEAGRRLAALRGGWRALGHLSVPARHAHCEESVGAGWVVGAGHAEPWHVSPAACAPTIWYGQATAQNTCS